jgi:glycerol-3-phosphate acyltransferase PlsY
MKELFIADTWYYFVLGAIISYLIGCFNFAVLISKIKKKDIRNIGSGNPGTMNMSRTFGLKIGVINFLCDALKGAVPVLCGYFIFRGFVFAGTNVVVSDFARYFFGMFAVIGHIFPVTMKFKGGKGIASTMGLFWCALSCEVWWFVFLGILLLVAIFMYIFLTEWGSMGSLIGVSTFTIWQAIIFVLRYSVELSSLYVIAIFAVLLILNLLTWIAHRKNLCRLMCGEEHRTSVKKMIKKKSAKNTAN